MTDGTHCPSCDSDIGLKLTPGTDNSDPPNLSYIDLFSYVLSYKTVEGNFDGLPVG